MNILLSSYDFHEKWAQDVMKPLLRENMKVVVIPFSFDKKEVTKVEEFDLHYGKNGIHTPYILRPFHFYGIKDIEFIDYFRDNIEIAHKKVLSADIIFLTGGLPDQYLDRLEEFKLDILIKQSNALIIGASAGALIQIDHYHITPDDDYPIYQYQRGLGLVNGFEVEVHYCHSQIQNQGIERVIEEKGLPTYTIANDGGLVVEEKIIKTFGNAYLVK